MMKPGKVVVLVDSVEDAVTFYSDKLGFDIIELMLVEGGAALGYAELRKGKCHIIFRVPQADEILEFAQIKYAAMRGTGMFVEVKKGLEKYYARCKSKGVTILESPKKQTWGFTTFLFKDPFGLKIMVGEEIPGFSKSSNYFCGITFDSSKPSSTLLEEMIRRMRSFGISQRAAKKCAKVQVKALKRTP